MSFRCARFHARNKASPDPNCLCSPRQVCCEAASVVYRTCADDVDRLASKRGRPALACVDTGRNEDRGGDVAGVSATLSRLCTDQVDADLKSLWDVFRMADHLELAESVSPV